METKCPICTSVNRGWIEEQKAAGVAIGQIQIRANLFGMEVTTTELRSHFRNHMGAIEKPKAEQPKVETPETLDAIVALMPSAMTVLEDRIRTLERYMLEKVDNEEAIRWREYEQGRTGTVTLTNREVYKALIPKPDSIEKENRKAVSNVVNDIQVRRGFAIDKEGVIKQKLEALHAQEREDEENCTELWVIQAREEEARKEREMEEMAETVNRTEDNPSSK